VAGYASTPPIHPVLLQGTSAIPFTAGCVQALLVPPVVGKAKDTMCFGFHIIANGTAASVSLAGFLDSTGAAQPLVWTGSTTQDVIVQFPSPLLNDAGQFIATPSVAGKVWLYVAPYLGGPT
jgi:hypothetical protein